MPNAVLVVVKGMVVSGASALAEKPCDFCKSRIVLVDKDRMDFIPERPIRAMPLTCRQDCPSVSSSHLLSCCRRCPRAHCATSSRQGDCKPVQTARKHTNTLTRTLMPRGILSTPDGTSTAEHSAAVAAVPHLCLSGHIRWLGRGEPPPAQRQGRTAPQAVARRGFTAPRDPAGPQPVCHEGNHQGVFMRCDDGMQRRHEIIGVVVRPVGRLPPSHRDRSLCPYGLLQSRG